MKRDTSEGMLFIGAKPFMSYISSLVMIAANKKEVVIKARGKFISKAVDVAQMGKTRFLKEFKIKSIDVGSQEFENKEKNKKDNNTIVRKIRVSTITIVMSK